MARGIFIFILLWVAFGALLSTWRSWTPLGAWNLGKAAGFSFLAAAAATVVLGLIVYLF